MKSQNYILQELNDLKSSLPHLPQPYQVPDGYFAQLPEQILQHVKIATATNAAEETALLSPLLGSMDRKMPYTLPEGYFETLQTDWVWAADESVAEELRAASPLLASLQKETPFSVPPGYFEKTAAAVEKPAQPARVVKMASRNWFKYAAAAVTIALVATTAFFFINRPSSPDPNEKSYAWVEKNLKKVDTHTLEDFVELVPGDSAGAVTVSAEVSSLLKNVSDHDMQEFLMITGNLDADAGDADELFLN